MASTYGRIGPGVWSISMADRGANSAGADLHLELGATRGRGELVWALHESIRSGRLAAGTRLPSSRSLAKDLGIARNTVADAYGQLVAEGWLTARQGSGTRVADQACAEPPVPLDIPASGSEAWCAPGSGPGAGPGPGSGP